MENVVLNRLKEEKILFPLEEKETVYIKEGKYLTFHIEKEKYKRKVFQFVGNGAASWYDKLETMTSIQVETADVKYESQKLYMNIGYITKIPVKKHRITWQEAKEMVINKMKEENKPLDISKAITGDKLAEKYQKYMEEKEKNAVRV